MYPFALRYRATSSAADGSISSDFLHTYSSFQVIALNGEADMPLVDIVACDGVLMKGGAALIDSAAANSAPTRSCRSFRSHDGNQTYVEKALIDLTRNMEASARERHFTASLTFIENH